MSRPKKPVAVALKYEGRDAPRLTAKGQGELGQRIIELAQDHGIPLREDAELAGFLAQVDLGQEIPPNLYRAVAEILAFVYMMNGRAEEMLKRSQASAKSPGTEPR